MTRTGLGRLLVAALLISLMSLSALAAGSPEVIDPDEAAKDPDFAVQGEYLGEGALPDWPEGKVAAQVIGLGGGTFRAVLYRGGLPGDGWKRGDDRVFLEGTLQGKAAKLSGEKLTAKIADGRLVLSGTDGKRLAELKRTERQSPTLGEKPPEGAVVLFDGRSAEKFRDGVLTDMQTLEAGCTLIPQLRIGRLHLEFRLSWKPEARGQGRSNSGVYVGGCPEVQVLDSFGLEGAKNECGALYGRREPDVNMCLPPLVWQTYDIEITEPKPGDDGKPSGPPRMTVRHNGVVVHENIEVRAADQRGLNLQRHGNRVQYRNIWAVESP
jgi:hypothetical protein